MIGERIFAQDGAGELIIWVVIAFFWVVAQVFSKAKEKKARSPEPSRSATSPSARTAPHKPPTLRERAQRGLEDQLREFFEQLQPTDTAQDESLRSPPPVPVNAYGPRRDKALRTAPAAAPFTSKRAPKRSVPRVEPLDEMDTHIDEKALDTEAAYALRENTSESVNAFVNPRTLLVNLNYLRMNMPIVPISGLSATNEKRPRPLVHGRRALRESITNQIILSNPLAMGEDKSSYTKRIV